MGESTVARRHNQADPDSLRSQHHLGLRSAMARAGPGWYYDPRDQAVYRYWDGERWTEHKSEVFLTTTP